MDRSKIIAQYKDIVGKDSGKARNLVKKLDFKNDHYLLRCIAQTYLDESRFKYGSILREYVDQRKWRMAERYIIKAFKINSNCADVLYTMGEVRKINGQTDIAIYCFEKILKLGVREIAFGGCKTGLAFARELVNDSRFELYRLYYGSNNTLSNRYLSMYKKGLKNGAETIYKPLKKFLLD
jgi:tetratricopeptide (TPR) repeat protein